MPLTDRANLNRARQIPITIGRLQVTRCKANDNVLLSSNLTPTGAFTPLRQHTSFYTARARIHVRCTSTFSSPRSSSQTHMNSITDADPTHLSLLERET